MKHHCFRSWHTLPVILWEYILFWAHYAATCPNLFILCEIIPLKTNKVNVQNHGKAKMESVITVVTCVFRILIAVEMTDAASMDVKMTVYLPVSGM